MLVRISKGEIFFDEFNTGVLDNRWTPIPNDSLRYSLVELPDFLKMYHSTPDFMLLLEEPETDYIMDIKNNYVPLTEAVQAGMIVFREIDNSLEILEYYDVSKDESFVYEYMRLIRNGRIYSVYVKNVLTDPWELIASIQFEGAGKIGLIVKGPDVPGASEFEVDYVRIYKRQDFQVVNLPVNYKVEVYRQDGSILDARRVTDLYNGVRFLFDDIPPVNFRFKVYNSNDVLVYEDESVEVCGGDVFFYGPSLKVDLNGESLYQDEDFMLGYFKSGVVDFQLTVSNPYSVYFANVGITTMQYGDNQGYQYVKFLDEADGVYKDAIVLGDMNPNDSKVVTGRIFRSGSMIDYEYNPYKFNIRITTD